MATSQDVQREKKYDSLTEKGIDAHIRQAQQRFGGLKGLPMI